MIPLIQILNCEELEIHLVLLYVYKEFCDAMSKDFNYEIKIISNSSQLIDDGIILMGNKFNEKSHKFILEKLCKFEKAIFLGWYWKINIPESLYPKRFIHIADDKHKPYHDIELFNFYRNCKNFVPLLMRANENPEKIGTYEKNIKYDYCFMGYRYSPELVPDSKYRGIYHGTFNHSEFLDYATRKEIYLSSIFALGFHGDEPIRQCSISQRVFEGMSYGCVVLTTSKFASEYTDGIAIYVSTKKEIEDKIDYFKNNPEEIKSIQNKGYEWCKKYGTNRYAWKLFLEKFKELEYI